MHDDVAREVERLVRELPQYREALAQYDQKMAEIQGQLTQALQPAWDTVSKTADHVLKVVRASYPPNWPAEFDLNFAKLQEIAEREGIPISYIPRGNIVREIMAAQDQASRLGVIEDRSEEIAEDCRLALDVTVHQDVADRAVLARKAVDAFIAGHHEPAQALAVVVCDSYLKTHLTSGAYKKMREELALGTDEEVALWAYFHVLMPLATAVPFLVDWRGKDNETVPTTFSRHVTIHGASTAQLNRVHAILAIMLVTAMTRALDSGITEYGSVAAVKGN